MMTITIIWDNRFMWRNYDIMQTELELCDDRVVKLTRWWSCWTRWWLSISRWCWSWNSLCWSQRSWPTSPRWCWPNCERWCWCAVDDRADLDDDDRSQGDADHDDHDHHLQGDVDQVARDGQGEVRPVLAKWTQCALPVSSFALCIVFGICF